jgi:hypothetical protein
LFREAPAAAFTPFEINAAAHPGTTDRRKKPQVTLIVKLPLIEANSVSMAVIVSRPLVRSFTRLKVCTPLSAAVKV